MRDFQNQALDALRCGKSIFIIAPTGLGKTRAALQPFAEAKKDGHSILGTRLLYILPLRALTQGVREELKELSLRGVVHHGEMPESTIFSEGACITHGMGLTRRI